MAGNGKYIYCVIPTEGESDFDMTGVEDHGRVCFIRHEGMAAVVSGDSPGMCEPTRKNMLAHNRVLHALMGSHTVLPARFGLVSDSEEDVKRLLAKYYPVLREYIRRLENRIEVAVKVFWRKDMMLPVFAGREPKLARLKEAIDHTRPEKAQALLAAAGEIVQTLSERWQVEYGDEMYLALMKVAVDGVRSYPVDISNTLNASFLVDKARQQDFDVAIDKLDAQYDKWANIRYVSPLPPYNFVSLEMYLH